MKSFFSKKDPPSFPFTESQLSGNALLELATFLNQEDFENYREMLEEEKLVVPERPDSLSNNANAFYRISKAAQLLKATEYADYNKAGCLIADDPSLMFEPVSFKFHDGSEERISPLRYTFKVLDTYMWWGVFFKKIEEIADPEKKAACRKNFFKQMEEQKQAGHINLEPLFQAYEEYNDHYQYWRIHRFPPLLRLDRRWSNLGKKQKELPVHMLKEFSREDEGHTWHVNAPFDLDQRPPSNCQIYKIHDYIIAVWNLFTIRHPVRQPLSSILSDSDWGTSFALIRNENMAQAVQIQGDPWLLSTLNRAAHADLAIFRRLFEVRSRDFAALSSMPQNALESQKQHNQKMGR